MNKAVLAWLPKSLTPSEVTGKSVLEVGSYYINGTAWAT